MTDLIYLSINDIFFYNNLINDFIFIILDINRPIETFVILPKMYLRSEDTRNLYATLWQTQMYFFKELMLE
jgi:hypothetical protein